MPASNADVIRTMVMTAGEGDLEAIYTTVREALEGDSNDAEHAALVDVADLLGIGYGDEPGPVERCTCSIGGYQQSPGNAGWTAHASDCPVRTSREAVRDDA